MFKSLALRPKVNGVAGGPSNMKRIDRASSNLTTAAY